jgi:hypothetical protein
LFAVGIARASMIYPPIIASHLGVSCQPACTICHRDLNGGLGTVTRKFGMNLQAYFGLTYGNPAALISALDKADAMHLDSDGDGDTDIDALRACRDPNQPFGGDGGATAGTGGVPPVEWGCASMTARVRDDAPLPVTALFGLSGVLVAARRRHRRPR